MKIYEDHKAQRDQFEVIAFHDASVKSMDALEEKMEPLIANRWNGKPLPFPILHDATGTTIKQLGVRGYPTLILVNPEGKVEDQALGGGKEKQWLAKMFGSED